MRAPLALPMLAIAIALVTAPLDAQPPAKMPKSPIAPHVPPKLPPPAAIADTVMVSSLSFANGATFTSGPLSLNHVLFGGLRPTQFRVSKFADFHDATWSLYLPSTVPEYRGTSTGTCSSPGTVLMVAHFQVRAPKPNTTKFFVHSNVARDTTCFMIGG